MCSLFEEIADKAALEGELDVSKTLQNLQPEARRHFVEMLCAWTSNIPVDNENCGKTYHDTTGTKLCMLLEVCNCGDIEEYMKKFEEPFTPEELRGIALMVVFALQAADDFCQFRHNDFKALNVLLHKFPTPERNAVFRYVVKGSELRFTLPEGFEYCAKIGDFGFQWLAKQQGRVPWTSSTSPPSKTHRPRASSREIRPLQLADMIFGALHFSSSTCFHSARRTKRFCTIVRAPPR